MKAMILAAGRGERLRPLTDTMPKSLVEVRGQSLLERHLEHISNAGIKDVVINLGWLGEQIVARVGSGSDFGLNIAYSAEGDHVLETGGGIFKALPLLGGEPFLVVNADIFTEMPVPEVTLADDALGHLVLVPTPAYRQSGDFDLHGDTIRNGSTPALTFAGVAIYRPEFFAACTPGRFSIVPLMRACADAGHLQGSVYDGVWADVGTPQRLAALD
jgi:N-acetyl-alpha-D-muramate 1-phosphate uridylyltransferase